MAGCSAGSSERGMDEIRRMLEDFNEQQRECPEHQLEPVNEWSQTMVEKLPLREDHDILLIDPETAVSKILSSGENMSKRAALQKFFSEHLSEMNFHTAINNVEATLAEFISCNTDEEKTKILPKLVDNLRNAKSLIKDPERFERAILGLENFDEFVNVFSQLSYWNDSAVLETLISDISELSLTLLPLAEEVRNIIKATKLEKLLCNKISLSKLTEITSTDAGQSLLEKAAWRLLRGLTYCNYKVRNEAGFSSSSSSQSGNRLSAREQLKKRDSKASTLHPMDVLHASFLCCDAVTKQFLCQRLFACKLAFPFLYRNEFNKLVQSDWALRDICFDFSDNDGKSIEMSLMSDSHQLPVVSFMRIGEIMVSKSKALNHLLNPENLETFFNRHSENGTLRRTCSDGLVEAVVRLPTRDSQAPMFLALNLRGDMESHADQTAQLIQMSHICVLFVCGKELCDEGNIEMIKNIKQKVCDMVIVVSKHERCTIDEDKLLDACEQHFEALGITIVIFNLSSGSLSDADFIERIKLTLDELLLQKSPPRLENVLSNRDPAVDAPLKAVSLAAKLYEELCGNSQKIHCAFLLQGDPWKKLSDCQRAQYSVRKSGAEGRNSVNALHAELVKCRKNQIELFENQSCLLLFIAHLRELGKTSDQWAYFESLRFLLENHTRKQSPELRKNYLDLKCSFESSLKSWRTQNSGDRVRLPAEIQELEQQFKRAENEFQESKVELNHFFRELSLAYDAHAHINEADIPGPIQELPRIFASLLLSGMPLELLDGNVGNIPMKWISAVLLECKRQVGDKKLFVVSVLGTQSTGKSTLLNTMFGLRLPVSSGRCTRGAFLQLVHVDEGSQLPFDYLAVIDTEGLRAIERSGNNQRHDNELATLVIGLADLTLITVNGEDSPDMRDILEIVIHVFIKMKGVQSLDIKRRCLFVHQNVSDAGASERLRTDIIARQSELDTVTREAAEKECVAGVSSFSDIISFSPDSDTFLMPSLWYGDPPTAPVNEGFSKEVQRLKQHIIRHHQYANGTYLSFTDFALRTKDLWRAVQTEDFVFSFRNSIEMKAYRLLDEKFAQIRSEFSSLSFEFLESTIEPRVKFVEKKQSLKKAREDLEAKLLNHVDGLFATSKSQLKKYFSDTRDISQWEATKLYSLETAKEEFQRKLKKELRGLIRIRKIILEQDEEIDKIKLDLRKASDLLFVLEQSSNSDDLTEEKLRHKFDSFWRKTLDKIAQTEAPDIEAKLKDALLQKFSNDRPLIEAELSKALISSPATEISEISELTGASAGDPTVLKTIEKTVLKNVWDYLCDIESKMRSFKDSDAKKVIDQTFYLLSNKMQTEQNSLKVQVTVYASRLAHRKFCDMQAKFVAELSLKSRLEKENDHYFDIFKSWAKKRRLDAAKIEFQMHFKSKMQEMLKPKALLKLRKFFPINMINSKRQLIKLLLTNEIDEDPSVTELYLTDPKAAALRFITLRTEKNLLQNWNSSEQCKYWSVIEEDILNRATDALLKAIQKPEIRTSDSLIEAFCRACSSSDIPFTKTRMKKICQDGQLSFQELSNTLKTKIPEAGREVLTKVKKLIQDETAVYDKPSEFESLCRNILNRLWGCDHRCPLCSEPCMMMDANHADNDKTPHCCLQHRPMGLRGTELHHKNEIAKYTCNYFGVNISAVLQGAKGVFGAEKKFQCSGCSRRQTDCLKESETELVFHKCFKYKTYFPDWDIEPDYSAPVSDLWKWLASSNRDRLVAKSKYYSKIPEEWNETTKESAKLCLETIYGDFESTVEPEHSGADVSADVGNRCQNEVVPFGQPNAIALSTIAER